MECTACKHQGVSLDVCAGCHSVRYCGLACQARDWNNGHKDKCPLYAELQDIVTRLEELPQHYHHHQYQQQHQQQQQQGQPQHYLEQEQTDSLIGKPVKRNTPEDDGEYAGKRSEQSKRGLGSKEVIVDDRHPPEERDLRRDLAPLTRDVLRLISLMVLLDSPVLMRASPAWRVFYQQIDWKQHILSRWDASTLDSVTETLKDGTQRTGAIMIKSIGDWLFDYSIMRMYPELMDNDIAETKDAFFALFQSLQIGDVEGQMALMNVCILYRMYEHNVRAFALAGAVFPPDHPYTMGRIVTHSHISSGNYDIDGGVPAHYFCVEFLTQSLSYMDPDENKLFHLKMVDERPVKSIFDYLRLRLARGRLSFDRSFTIYMVNTLNFPKALTRVAALIQRIHVIECRSPWSAVSISNFAKMSSLKEVEMIDCSWDTFPIDVYAVCPILTVFEITDTPPGFRLGANKQFLGDNNESVGVFRPTRSKRCEVKFEIEKRESVVLRPRRIPPGPYGGLSRDVYVENILDRAFSIFDQGDAQKTQRKEDTVHNNRLSVALKKAGLLPLSKRDPGTIDQFQALLEQFTGILETTKVSPLPGDQNLDDPRNIAVPFRIWFASGIQYYRDGRSKRSVSTVVSYANEACFMSAERRRGKGAYPSLEELAEALCAWYATVSNLRIMAQYRGKPRLDYCEWLTSAFDASSTVPDGRRIFSLTSNPFPLGNNTYVGGLVMPHEWVMKYVLWIAKKRAEGVLDDIRGNVKVSVSEFTGGIPAWLWLLDKAFYKLEFECTGDFYLPPQLMYHTGLRILKLEVATSNLMQVDLFRTTREARPQKSLAQEGTFLHEYYHDFQDLDILWESRASADWLPLIDTAGYDRLFLHLSWE